MLCRTTTEKDFKNQNWDNFSANIKYDGERILAQKVGTKVTIWNRRGKSKAFVYPEVTEALEKIEGDFVIDGEVITDDGIFNSLQRRSGVMDIDKINSRLESHPVKYMVFDILYLKGIDTRREPLDKRVEKLKELFKLNSSTRLELVEYYEDINLLWKQAKDKNWEGIILKEMSSFYEFKRSHNWIKLKNFKEEIIEFDSYVLNPAGLRLSNGIHKVQVPRLELVEKITHLIDKNKKVKVNVQYLEKTKEGQLRMPTCKEVIFFRI